MQTASECVVRIGAEGETPTLAAFYLRCGYHGGISAKDVAYVAEREGQIVGLVRRSVEEGVVMLRGMQVDPAHQRSGVGSQLLLSLVADLPAGDCYCVPFSHLTGFYGNGGFELVPEHAAPDFLVKRVRRYREEGHNVLIMRRPADADIAALEAQLRAAQLDADVDALGRLIHDDLLFMGPDGSLGTKAADLASYRDGVMRVSQHEPEELRVRRVGSDVAVVALRTHMRGSYAGVPFSGTAHYTRVWAREGGGDRWQIVAGQVSVSGDPT